MRNCARGGKRRGQFVQGEKTNDRAGSSPGRPYNHHEGGSTTPHVLLSVARAQSLNRWLPMVQTDQCPGGHQHSRPFHRGLVTTLTLPPAWQAKRQDTLWRKGCEVDTVSVSINNKLGHSKAAGRSIQDAPAAMARGDVGSSDVGHLAQEREAILSHRAITRLHALRG